MLLSWRCTIYSLKYWSSRAWHEAPLDGVDTSDEAIVRERWVGVLEGDSYHNPNLSRERADFPLGK